MRYTLGIDTAAPDGSVALAQDGRAVAAEPLLPREHSSGLSLAVERLLASRGLTIGDLTGVAVSEGPGSFTGLRIGLAWAKGLALGRGLPIALVSSHAVAADAGRAGSPPRLPGAAVAEIGDRLLAAGSRADLVLAAPAYGREPNARKPGS